MSHTRQRVGSRKESFPPSTWTESGQTPVLPTIVKQPQTLCNVPSTGGLVRVSKGRLMMGMDGGIPLLADWLSRHVPRPRLDGSDA